MRKGRYSESQIVGILKEHQAGLGAAELCRTYGISDVTAQHVKKGGRYPTGSRWIPFLRTGNGRER